MYRAGVSRRPGRRSAPPDGRAWSHGAESRPGAPSPDSLDSSVGGQRYGGDPAAFFEQRAHHDQPVAVLLRHADVGQQHVEARGAERGESVAYAVTLGDVRPQALEQGRDELSSVAPRRPPGARARRGAPARPRARRARFCRRGAATRERVTPPTPSAAERRRSAPVLVLRSLPRPRLRGRRRGCARSTGRARVHRGGAWSRLRPGGSARRRKAGTRFAIPIPVSATTISMESPRTSRLTRTRPSRGVHLTAFESRFQTTC